MIAGAVATLQRSWVRLQRGRLDLAVADGERALEIYRYGWTSSPWSTPILAEAHIARGDLDAAREAIAVGERAGGERPEFGLLLEAKARLHLAEGDPAAALGQALDAGEHAEGGYGIVQPRVWSWRRLAATAAHRMRRDAEGMELIEPDLAALRKSGPARQLGAALTAAGLVIGGDEGLDLLGEAATVLEPSPAALQRAETLVELGGALRRAGRRTAAKEPLLASLALAAELGALPLERRARDELRGLGLKPRRAERTGVASLTPTELRVAGLAADGLSTPQIAYELHVTRNTVETHLRHIYRKLDLSGRGQLHAALTAAPVAG